MNQQQLPTPPRLVSLDAYRGFVMLAMASAGLGLAKTAQNFPDCSTMQFLGYQFSHVDWTGCAFWDLIQPSFMFIVGVAMPFSLARRIDSGQSYARLFGHAVARSAILVALAILLTSNWSDRTVFEFPNVLAQIGLGYWFVFLFVHRSVSLQLAVTTAILAGYWLFFYLWYPGPQFFPESVELPADWNQFASPLASHWNKYVNAAGAADVYFLNLFPREETFWFNRGGYQTLNFFPSMATMLMGVMAGRLLKGTAGQWAKCGALFGAGLLLLLFGMTIDHTIWPDWLANRIGAAEVESVGFASREWTLCPIVKRIWTPSWAIFSTGWTLLLLALFYLTIDVWGFKRLAFPMVVVGMNSIAIYMMAQLMSGWIWKTLQIHFGYIIVAVQSAIGRGLIDSRFEPMVRPVAVLCVLWLICLWLYRRRIFLRI